MRDEVWTNYLLSFDICTGKEKKKMCATRLECMQKEQYKQIHSEESTQKMALVVPLTGMVCNMQTSY